MTAIHAKVVVRCLGGLLLALATALSPAVAGVRTWDATTYVTFNEPVELPGVALAAGTYVFRLPDGLATPLVVEVLSEDGSTINGLFHGVERDCLEPNDSPVEMFKGSVPGMPEAVRSWFLPDDKPLSVEFVYPTQQAELISSWSRQPVLSVGQKYVDYGD